MTEHAKKEWVMPDKWTLEDVNKVLSDVQSHDQAFFFCDGTIARNIYELIDGIERLNSAGFVWHVNREKNDFANWIRNILKYPELADRLAKSKDQKEHIAIIRQAVETLESMAFPQA